MDVMNYTTPRLEKIDFEDNFFVITGVYSSERLAVKEYIESRGGIIKDSVTKATNYVIYDDITYETKMYKKALELVREKGLEIMILGMKTFRKLLTMKETTDVPEIIIEGRRFIAAGLDKEDRAVFGEHVKKHGGILEDSMTEGVTDYLIFNDLAWETKEYTEAMSMKQDGGTDITILSFSTFMRLCRDALETMEFGTYLPKKGGERMPIRWIVVKKEKNKALLLFADGICHRPYNEQYTDVTWETCTLRKWLNEDFYNEVFTEEEKKRICLTEVRNEDNPSCKTPGGNDTEDRVFLLSTQEAEKWLTKIERLNGNWWWLRSVGNRSDEAAIVFHDGDISDSGIPVSGNNAVCPALWIDLGSESE